MNPKLILTVQHGIIISAIATGRIDVVVNDLDMRKGGLEPITPELKTIAEMQDELSQIGFTPSPNFATFAPLCG